MTSDGRARAVRATAPRHWWLVLPALLLFVVAYLSPLGRLVYASLTPGGDWSFSAYTSLLGSAPFWSIVTRTLRMAVVVTIVTLVIAYPAAYCLSRISPRKAALLLVFVAVPYLTSVLIRSYAWIVILGPRGVVNNALLGLGLIDEPLRLVFNQVGAYIGMVQIQLPLMIFALYVPMRRIDRTLLNAAQSLGSNRTEAFVQVFLPLSMSGMIGGSTLVFLSCLGFYVTPALLGGPSDYMIAQAIQVRVQSLADYNAAAAQGTLLLLVVVIAFLVLRKQVVEGISETVASVGNGPGDGFRSNWLPPEARRIASRCMSWIAALGEHARLPAMFGLSTACLIYLVAPMFVVAMLSFSDASYLTFPPPGYSLRWFEAFFADDRWMSAMWFSLQSAGIAAVISLLIAAPAAFGITRGRFFGRLGVYLLLISPLVVPRIIIGVAALFAFVPVGLSGTKPGFVIAYSLIAVPYVLVLFITGLRRFDRSLEMAAAGLGASTAVVLRTVTIPLLLPTIASSFLFAFIAAFDDVELGIFLSAPDATPLPIRMLENMRLEISPQIAVIGVLLLGALAIGYGVVACASLALRSRTLSGPRLPQIT